MAQENMEDHGGSSEVSGKRSAAWSHFVRSEDGETAICKNCNSILRASSKRNGTSTLNRHTKFFCSAIQQRLPPPPAPGVDGTSAPPASSSILTEPSPAQPHPSSTHNEPPLALPCPRTIAPAETLLPHPSQGSWFDFDQQEEWGAELDWMTDAFDSYPSPIVEPPLVPPAINCAPPETPLAQPAAHGSIDHPEPSLAQQPRPSSTTLHEPSPAHHPPPETSLAHPDQGTCRFNQQEYCAAELAGMIAFHGYPSSIVEDECFRSFLRGLNPHFQMPSRAAIEAICNSRAVDAMKQLMETLAGCSGQISLVTDTIETGQGRALYMACQFVDDEWAFHKRIMQVFRVVRFPPYGHSALLGAEDVCLNVPEAIQKQLYVPGPSSKLEEAVGRWGLQGRLFSVAWGGQQLKTCLENKNFLHKVSLSVPAVHCVTYTSDVLDSVGETFLEALAIGYEEACLKAVKGLHLTHEKRTQDFSELGLNHVGRYDKRWYTYYCALEVLHKEYSDNKSEEAFPEQPTLNPTQLAELFTRLTPAELQAKVSNLLNPTRFKESIFTDLLRKIFGTVYRALDTLCSATTPTANLCLEELMKLRGVLQSEAREARTDVAKAIAHAKAGGFLGDKGADVVLGEVQDVMDSHLKETYLFLSMPAVLDPRLKLEYVATVLNEVFGSEAPAYISRVHERIENIFEEHNKRKLRSITNGEGTSRMAARTGTAAMDIDSNTEASITELERYLTDGLVPREDGQGFDVLVWWKANSSRYPTVASMARDALAMPVSDMLSPEHIARIRSMMSSYCFAYPDASSND